MKCLELLEGLEYKVLQGTVDCEVKAVVNDSRKASEGCLFLCIVGANFDGHDKAAEVVAAGASVLVVQKQIDLPENTDVTVILVENTRYAMALISSAWFGHPSREMKIIGITGTKGKTTTTYLVKSILEHAGMKVGLVGTIEAIIGDEHIPADNTTPESFLLQEYFRRMADAGCEAVVMEVSSQGLMQHRVAGIEFELGILTNISPDHISPTEHKDFDDYMRCKGMLFTMCRRGIVNMDCEQWETVTAGHTCELTTYGFSKDASLYAENVELIRGAGYLGVKFDAKGMVDFPVEFHAPGRFSVYNALTAIAICEHFGVKKEAVQAGLKEAKVRGRIELLPVGDHFSLMTDYAHNAMALESLLTTLKEYNPGRLVCLFGCGGNRSKLRRFEMGEVSGQLADLTIITSDNPRFEKPADIIADIVTGISKTDGVYVTIPDRREAIAFAIKEARPGDIVVLAGKGHEPYQEIEGVKYHMDEREIVADVMAGKQAGPANLEELVKMIP